MTQKEMAAKGGRTMTPKRMEALKKSIKKAQEALALKRKIASGQR